MELSGRLQAVADLITPGGCVADIGTDHGYLPIYLVESQKNQHVIAMDINVGPLERAREHITEHGLGNYIETRLSDGLSALVPGEVDSVVMAGIGGALVIRIMREGEAVLRQARECILQPQSELYKVRAYLQEAGYLVTEEDMVIDDGKYYPMMRVVRGADTPYTETELLYGRKLLAQRHPVLGQYLRRERKIKEQILRELDGRSGEKIDNRRSELESETARIRTALQMFDQEKL